MKFLFLLPKKILPRIFILFCSCEENNILNWLKILKTSQPNLGLRTKHQNSPYNKHPRRGSQPYPLDCATGSWPSTYLKLSTGDNPVKRSPFGLSDWQNSCKHLSGKGPLLCKVGRLVFLSNKTSPPSKIAHQNETFSGKVWCQK